MCKFNPKNNSRFIDPCLEITLIVFDWAINKRNIKIVASYCRHGKYSKTIVAIKKSNGQAIELITETPITRKKK